MKLLLDACVLYPTVIRNLLISVSGEQKWDLIWTEQIFEEWRRASNKINLEAKAQTCLLYTSPSPRDGLLSRMPSSA